jgi:hypothetical protein
MKKNTENQEKGSPFECGFDSKRSASGLAFTPEETLARASSKIHATPLLLCTIKIENTDHLARINDPCQDK